MQQQPSDDVVQVFAEVAKALGATAFHVTPVRICEVCEDPDQEAAPYGVTDSDGNYYDWLCNDCFDALREQKGFI